jgi:hypothetical protein
MNLTLTPAKRGMVVLRFLDGRLLKGTTQDFFPDRTEIHLHEDGDESRPPLKVALSGLKAVFFVRTFAGDTAHERHDELADARGQGRKVIVHFRDGEVLRGFTVGYNPAKRGFFVIPSDAGCNNMRAYVFNEGVDRIEWWHP